MENLTINFVAPQSLPQMDVISSINFCRICLIPQTETDMPYEMFHREYSLAEIFEALTSIPVTPDDGLPHLICTDCETKLSSAFEFRQKCIDADHKFRSELLMADEKSVVALSSAYVEYEFTDSSIIVEEKFRPNFMENETNSVHNEEQVNVPIKSEISSTKPFKCEICSKQFTSRRRIGRHMKSHVQLEGYKCTYCKAG